MPAVQIRKHYLSAIRRARQLANGASDVIHGKRRCTRRPGFLMLRKITWTVMACLALAVAAYAAAALASPAMRTPFIANLFATLPVAIATHLAGGLVAIAAGALQVNSRLRRRSLSVHRWLGRLYVVAVIVGSVAGFILALSSFGGLVTHFGFGLMAICWLGTTMNAYRHIRIGNVLAHRAWMLRSYALTLAAVTLRLYLPVSLANGIEFESAYQLVSWLSWVPNLLIVEWFVLARRPPSLAAA
jgi:uncharacterized membrane protein